MTGRWGGLRGWLLAWWAIDLTVGGVIIVGIGAWRMVRHGETILGGVLVAVGVLGAFLGRYFAAKTRWRLRPPARDEATPEERLDDFLRGGPN